INAVHDAPGAVRKFVSGLIRVSTAGKNRGRGPVCRRADHSQAGEIVGQGDLRPGESSPNVGAAWLSGSADGLGNARELVLRVVVETNYAAERVRNGVNVLVIINAGDGGYISDGDEIPVCIHDLDRPEQSAGRRERLIRDHRSIPVAQDVGGAVVFHERAVVGIVKQTAGDVAVVGQGALPPIAFSKDHLSVSRIVFQVAKVQAEAVAGEVPIRVEADIVGKTTQSPNSAVVIEREVQIETAAG